MPKYTSLPTKRSCDWTIWVIVGTITVVVIGAIVTVSVELTRKHHATTASTTTVSPSTTTAAPSSSIPTTAVWVNSANSGIKAGTGLAAIPGDDIMLIFSSYNPNPFAYGCNNIGFNYLYGGLTTSLLAMSQAAKAQKPHSTILISVGGSSFGETDFCELVIPWLTEDFPAITDCASIPGSPSGSNTSATCTPKSYIGGATCPNDSGNGTYPSFTKHTTSATACGADRICHCCCLYGYAVQDSEAAEPCVSTATTPTPSTPPPPPPASTCPTETYPVTVEGRTNLLCAFFAGSEIDGLDLDYESPDTMGYVAHGLVRMAQAVVAQCGVIISITLEAGPTMGGNEIWHPTDLTKMPKSYTPIYNCIATTCPFTYTVVMPYANCMYPRYPNTINTSYYNSSTHQWVTTDINAMASQPFYWDELMRHWLTSYITPSSTTKLSLAVIVAPHNDWAPCPFTDFDYLKSAFIPGNYTRGIEGYFVFWYDQMEPPTPGGYPAIYNSTYTTHSINQWYSLFT